MTRRSAAKVKAIKSEKWEKQPELPPLEETFDNIKQVIVNTAEVSIAVAKRVENLGNLRSAAYKFWGNELDAKMLGHERIEYFKKLVVMSVECYGKILEIVKTWELEEFLKEDMKDYFADLMPHYEAVETEEDLFEAMLVADMVKPWGEKMTQLHHQILDEKKQREFQEAE